MDVSLPVQIQMTTSRLSYRQRDSLSGSNLAEALACPFLCLILTPVKEGFLSCCAVAAEPVVGF